MYIFVIVSFSYVFLTIIGELQRSYKVFLQG